MKDELATKKYTNASSIQFAYFFARAEKVWRTARNRWRK